MRNERYFNFPIKFLNGFLTNSRECLQCIIDYAVYSRFMIETGTKAERLVDCEEYFGISLGSRNKTYLHGKELYESRDIMPVMAGISKNIYFDFLENDKSEFDKVCLLGFLAIKSILGKKPYCKIDNKYWLARMDGKAKSCEKTELSNEINKYANNYQARKIKSALVDSWNLKTYSYYTRGFYVSFELDLDDLSYQAEKRKKSNRDKLRKDAEKLSRKRALAKLFTSQP